MTDPRVGLGFDSHSRDVERTLVLGGLRFEGETGLSGHSDGDVVCHALADALLGAGALGDLGAHFPDTDPSMAGIAGADLLARAVTLLEEAGLHPRSCDLVVIAERPLLGPRRDEMRRALAAVLSIEPDHVSVKATRPEGVGLSGDGAACMAVAVVAER